MLDKLAKFTFKFANQNKQLRSKNNANSAEDNAKRKGNVPDASGEEFVSDKSIVVGKKKTETNGKQY